MRGRGQSEPAPEDAGCPGAGECSYPQTRDRRCVSPTCCVRLCLRVLSTCPQVWCGPRPCLLAGRPDAQAPSASGAPVPGEAGPVLAGHPARLGGHVVRRSLCYPAPHASRAPPPWTTTVPASPCASTAIRCPRWAAHPLDTTIAAALTAGLLPVAAQTARDPAGCPAPYACGWMRWSVGLGGSREGPAQAECPVVPGAWLQVAFPGGWGWPRISTGILTPPSSLPVRPSALSTGPGHGGSSGLWVGLRAAVGSWDPCSPRQAVRASRMHAAGGPLGATVAAQCSVPPARQGTTVGAVCSGIRALPATSRSPGPPARPALRPATLGGQRGGGGLDEVAAGRPPLFPHPPTPCSRVPL